MTAEHKTSVRSDVQPSSRQVRLSWRERLGYGGGDFGFNLYWTTMASFLAAFYTDVFGISAAAAGTMLLITKIVDAFSDPAMGMIADRTKSPHGKYRPYLIIAGLPMAVAAVLTFTIPDLGGVGKLVWAYVTYTVMMLIYTFLNTPYSALSGVMTASSQERTTLISIRFIFAFSGGALVNKFTVPLVQSLGNGDVALGWQLTLLLYGLCAAILFAITFFTTRERVAPEVEHSAHPKDDLRDLLSNGPWLILFALAMLIVMTTTMRAGSAYYFLTYYLDRADLLSDYLFVQMVAYAAGAVMTPLLTRHIDKARLLTLLLALVGSLSIVFYFIPVDETELIFALNILISLALGPKAPLIWSMYADTADYNEWRHGRRATATTFATATFSQKLGGSLGSAGMLWLLAGIGYSANEAQTDASLVGIALLQTIIPGVFALVAAGIALFYTLTEDQMNKIQYELDQRGH